MPIISKGIDIHKYLSLSEVITAPITAQTNEATGSGFIVSLSDKAYNNTPFLFQWEARISV